MFDTTLRFAIRLASAAVILGWILSAVGELTLRGYFIAGVPALVVIGFFSGWQSRRPNFPSRRKRMFHWWKRRRLLPLIFLFTFFLIVCGSILHEPNNFDGLSYRIPKILNWTQQNRWHWIDTPFGELNYTLPNYEWLALPFFLVTGGFHATVVINWIAYLFLPPLFFSLLRAFGASRRLAYDWMWIFPSAYLIAMQAGGIGNDLLGLTAILAALHCARRFAVTQEKGYLFDALLAAGFCTGIKLSNLPLAGFVVIILGFPALRVKRTTLAMAVALSMAVSALIPLGLNLRHTGTILGTTSHDDQAQNPAAGLVGNSLISLVTTVAPPIFPGANQVSGAMEKSLGVRLDSWLRAHYAKFTLRLNELPQEEGGGLGLGITLALICNIALWAGNRKIQATASHQSLLARWQKMAWWAWLGFSVMVLSSKLGTGPAFPRNMLPWSPMLLAPVIAFFDCASIARSRVWRIVTVIVALSVLPALLLTPSRPLIPPALLFKLARTFGAPADAINRASMVYEVYAHRDDPFAPIKSELPENARILGLVSDGNEPTASWWKPYGSRRCVYLLSENAINAASRQGVQYVVLQEAGCRCYFNMDAVQWAETHKALVIKAWEIKLLAAVPPVRYTLVKMKN